MRMRMTSAFVAVTFALLIGVTVRASDEQIGKQIVERLQQQREAAHAASKATLRMVVLTVDIVRDGAADGD